MVPPGLQPLRGLTALRELHLCYCGGLSDAGVRAALAPLTRHSLAHIDVTGCSGLTQVRACSPPRMHAGIAMFVRMCMPAFNWCKSSSRNCCTLKCLQGTLYGGMQGVKEGLLACRVKGISSLRATSTWPPSRLRASGSSARR
jgi:hypothetical protein